MINSLELKNFQSHNDSKLEFHPGINAIVGASDKGKSAILRAFYLLFFNRPSGDGYVSYWIKNKSGIKKGEECRVTATTSNGFVSRIKTKDVNGYDVNGTTLKALRTDLPDEVPEFFQITDVNFQRQLDPPFLLSASPGAAAKYFNKTIKLEDIDTAMSLAESRKRKTKATLEPLALSIEGLETDLKKLETIPSAEELLKTLQDIDEEIKGVVSDSEKIVDSIQSYSKSAKITESLKTLPGILKDFEKLAESKQEITTLSRKINVLTPTITPFMRLQWEIEVGTAYAGLVPLLDSLDNITTDIKAEEVILADFDSSIASYSSLECRLQKYQRILDLQTKIDDLSNLKNRCTGMGTKKAALRSLIDAYDRRTGTITTLQATILELEASLPETCPTCGQPMPECEDST